MILHFFLNRKNSIFQLYDELFEADALNDSPCAKQMVQRVIILQLTTPLPFKIYSTCNGELVVVGYLLALLTLVLLLTLVHRYIVGRCAAAARTRC